MLVRAIALATIAVCWSGFHPSIAAEPSGEAVAVLRSAAANGASGNRVLETKSQVFAGDVVTTDKTGNAQILFRDDTRLVIGPSSEITIDKFVFADTSTARELTINAIRGAFRFITGSSQKQAYTINTPTATIGVRGTAFDVTIDDKATNLALYDGTVRMCDKTDPSLRCAELTGRCTVIILAPNEDFRWVRNIFERASFMDDVFPYAFQQSDLRTDFRVKSNACKARNPIRPNRDTDYDRKPKKRGSIKN